MRAVCGKVCVSECESAGVRGVGERLVHTAHDVMFRREAQGSIMHFEASS